MTAVLFSGAGAVSAAAAAALPDSVEVGVASRIHTEEIGVRRARRLRTPPTRVLRPIGYAAAADREWDLVVLTTRPRETDPRVLAFAAEAAPIVATTSQVPGDLAALAAVTRAAVILAPRFVADATSREPLQVSAWYPTRALFDVAGDHESVRAISALLPGSVTPSSEESVLIGAARTMPYMAELVVRGGDWRALENHLRRPAQASAEAVDALAHTRRRASSPAVVRLALDAVSALAPFDFPTYAARHFLRHAEQTLAMLDAWRTLRESATPALDDLRDALAEAVR